IKVSDKIYFVRPFSYLSLANRCTLYYNSKRDYRNYILIMFTTLIKGDYMANGEVVTIEQVVQMAREYLDDEDVSFIERAYFFAEKAHEGQYRKSGEPYIIHPVQVASILVELTMDPVTVAGGFLHDVVEDTEVTLEEIEENFNKEVALLVDGVTKLEKIKFKSKGALQAENHRKMFVAMAKDIRVILVKLADRLHNMRTLKHMPPEKQRRTAKE